MQDPKFITNVDECEFATKPAWVSVDDILNKTAPIDPLYIGLENIMMNYCLQQKKWQNEQKELHV